MPGLFIMKGMKEKVSRAIQRLGTCQRLRKTLPILWAALLCGVLFCLFVFESWPLSLRQGPDTVFARSCFRRYFAGVSDEAVNRIYCRKERGLRWGSSSPFFLRFSFRDAATLRAAIKRRSFVPVSVQDQSSIRYLSGPSWWPERERLSVATRVYEQRLHGYDWMREAMSLFSGSMRKQGKFSCSRQAGEAISRRPISAIR